MIDGVMSLRSIGDVMSTYDGKYPEVMLTFVFLKGVT